jgi:hypothetical protein
MSSFPDHLTPELKDTFPDIILGMSVRKMRKTITDLVYKGDENVCFDLAKFSRSNDITQFKTKEMVDTLVPELIALGWKCKFSFGDTGLFIYSTDKPPPSCWDGDF